MRARMVAYAGRESMISADITTLTAVDNLDMIPSAVMQLSTRPRSCVLFRYRAVMIVNQILPY